MAKVGEGAKGTATPKHGFTAEEVRLIAAMFPDLTEPELELTCYVSERKGLNPLLNQIYPIKRNVKMLEKLPNGQTVEKWVPKLTLQTAIDSFRLIAERTGLYRGQLGPFWCGPDGEWADVWVAQGAPAAAKVGILREGFSEPIWGIARFTSYNGGTKLWQQMPDVMIAKTAEALGFRRTFPQELGDIYTDEEMSQADNNPLVAQKEEEGTAQAAEAKDAKAAAKEAKASAKAELTTPAQMKEIGVLYRALGLTQRPDAAKYFRNLFTDTAIQDERFITGGQAAVYIAHLRDRLVSVLCHKWAVTDSGLHEIIALPEFEGITLNTVPVDGVHPPVITEDKWPAFLLALKRMGAAKLAEKQGEEADFSEMEEAAIDEWLNAQEAHAPEAPKQEESAKETPAAEAGEQQSLI